ncbi:MAG: MBL fold metallo-hydrolase [Deltaproteobacteria bacterium]|nr:MBL fold metallo-hydrolase [Deltaproteobacteria bacterium]MBW1934160.1 MBL fold metallo-hydrolase [Deltaproteobacteria bacterium]MBW1977162.1 MBL fold metallo-hydrolase [Deltaproteobacteria bacterium]MBW2043608.1 MBL fold metallo-hydrolase [Deltaproteobacteria bacterium]MBW2299038.1 MBL fold metallo-hydrolase [Deltaproteobacteria bacterium]
MKNRKAFSRRSFISHSIRAGAWASLLSARSVFGTRDISMTAREGKLSASRLRSLSLRELSEKKVHHAGGRFWNPFTPHEGRNIWRLLYWKLFSKNKFKSFYPEERVRPVRVDWRAVRKHAGCSVTFLKHACVMIKDIDKYLLVDPVFDGLFWIKDFTPLEFGIKEMPQPDHVLLTHGHFDHMDTDSLSVLKNNIHVITPLGYGGVFKDLEIKNRTQLDWFDSYRDERLQIMLLPCNHWTMRNPLVGPNRSLWGSFLIKCKSGINIYIAGDTAYFDRFKELGEVTPIDLAIFNLGAYEPRWFMARSHVNPEETARAFSELNARHLLIVHWGTFRLGDEPVHFPPRDIALEMKKRGLLDHLIHLDHGRTLHYDGSGNPSII